MKNIPLIIMSLAFVAMCVVAWSPKEYTPMVTATATLNFGITGAGLSSDLTMTVTGAAVGDVVALGIPTASITTTGIFFAWVSNANEVTVRYCNTDILSAIDPASGVFKSLVIKK
jgi:hypothetical protein